MSANSNRRDFLKTTSAGLAAGAAFSSGIMSAAPSANSKILVGLIGCGGRGTHDAGLFQKTPNVEVAYVADVDETRRGSVAAKLGVPANRAVSDMRKVLDDKSVDAVIVATPDHWHSPASIL